MTVDMGNMELDTLDEEECRALLRSHAVGRFAVNRPRACPLVVPVNYVVDATGAVVFRSGAGAKLNGAMRGLVGLQVDEIDPVHHIGWSVLLEGTARWLFAEQDATDVKPWAPGDRPYLVRVTPTRITGRRIRLPAVEPDSRAYL